MALIDPPPIYDSNESFGMKAWLQRLTRVVVNWDYPIGGFFPGVPTASMMLGHVFTRNVSLPASLVGSTAKAKFAATAQTDFDVQKNGVSVGTIRFAAAGTVGSFIMTNAQNFVSGDWVDIIAPAVPDATLADVRITLKGVRT